MRTTLGVVGLVLLGAMTEIACPSERLAGQSPNSIDGGAFVQEAISLGQAGKWAAYESLLRQAATRPKSLPVALWLLHEGYVKQEKFGPARQLYQNIPRRLKPAELGPLAPLLEVAHVRAALLEKAMPRGVAKSRLDESWLVAQIKGAVRSRNFAQVRSLSWSLVASSPILDGISVNDQIEALTALIAVCGMEKDRRRADTLVAANRRLLELTEGLDSNRGADLVDAYNSFVLGRPVQPTSFRSRPDPFWPYGLRELAAENPAAMLAIRRYLELCANTGADSALVVWKGRIVGEWYSHRYHGEALNCASSTKSVVSYLAGILVGEGKIHSVYDPVNRYLPTWGKGLKNPPTLYNLLTMTSGVAGPFSRNGVNTDGRIPNINEYVVRTMEPDTNPWFFEYSNYGVQLLSPILEKVCGEPLHRFARSRLLAPLSISRESAFATDTVGGTFVYGGLKIKARELARLGSLMLTQGRWQGRPIVPRDWIEAIAYPVFANPEYGMLWWLGKHPRSVSMMGSLNNNCVVVPSASLILVRQQKWDWTTARNGYDEKAPHTIAALAAALLEKHR